MSLRGRIFGPLWAPKWIKNSSLSPFFQKFYSGFTPVLVYMSIWATFAGVLNIGLRSPISGSFLGPKIEYNSSLQLFSQSYSIDFPSFLFYMLIRVLFMCISMMCPKGSISGPRVKFAAELVRPPGLLWDICLMHCGICEMEQTSVTFEPICSNLLSRKCIDLKKKITCKLSAILWNPSVFVMMMFSPQGAWLPQSDVLWLEWRLEQRDGSQLAVVS